MFAKDEFIVVIEKWLASKKLMLSSDKSSATMHKGSEPKAANITIGGRTISTAKPKDTRCRHGSLLTFNLHAASSSNKS